MLIVFSASAQYQRVNDIPYSDCKDKYAQERCKLDVYYPTDTADVPVVVWFHGGGIEAGNKQSIALGKEKFGIPEEEPRVETHFVR